MYSEKSSSWINLPNAKLRVDVSMLKTHTVDVSMPNTSTVDNNFSPPKQTTAADYYQRISKPETSTQTTADDCLRISKPKDPESICF